MSSSAANGPGLLGRGVGRPWSVPGYTEVRNLGEGTFGEVVLAVHDATRTLVAIKYLKQDLLRDPAHIAQFHAEATALGTLGDPHVVRLYEYVEQAPAGAAIVMEVIEGVSLTAILKRQGKTTPEAALVVLYGSLLGLAAAHARGVVHRDYKPDNVLVNGHGVSKLTDFGIAVRSGAVTPLTGTMPYMPPEQFEGAPASPAADVYAAAVTFYQCLTGQLPFDGRTLMDFYEQHKNADVPLALVPEPLQPVLMLGMAKDPLYRPSNAAYLAAELRNAALGAYGPGWEERGRSQLGEAALLLALLWPSAGTPAVSGSAVEQVQLTEPAQGAQRPQLSQAARRRRHLLHVLHLEHLEHLTYLLTLRRRPGQQGSGTSTSEPLGKAGQRSQRGSRLRRTASAVTAAAVIAAAGTVLVTRLSDKPPSPPQQAVVTESLATIPMTLASDVQRINGFTVVAYDDPTEGSATVSGTLAGAAPGEVIRLYAQRFPFTAAPSVAGTVTLAPADGKASYTFTVSPTLATRYQVRLFSDAKATVPLASSVIQTIYVAATYSSADSGCTGSPVCHGTFTVTVHMPASAIRTEMAKRWYAYFGITTRPAGEGTPPSPATLRLGAGNITMSPFKLTSADSFTFTVSFSADVGDDSSNTIENTCLKDTPAQDGLGVPGPLDCGDSSVPTNAAYIG